MYAIRSFYVPHEAGRRLDVAGKNLFGRDRHLRSVPSDQSAGDDHPLHLRGALADFAELCIPHVPFHGVFPDVPVTPEDLYRLDRGAHGRLGCEELRDRGLLDERLVITSYSIHYTKLYE